ncbi:hypothetical protein GCM10010094_25370 [Streptomyces flaveus]|uniref:Uncharacterized protein n=1 Tax=Streptomyces flaveus TaxID=66370 RepID=A0A917QQ76_9ACTN|nr:hypothetical protein GCM10010094_25370 [Streptomyces flaveus]
MYVLEYASTWDRPDRRPAGWYTTSADAACVSWSAAGAARFLRSRDVLGAEAVFGGVRA